MAKSWARAAFDDKLKPIIRPVATKMLHSAIRPSPTSKWFYAAVFRADMVSRELYEWGWRSLVATPAFLSRCEHYGNGISVDQIPYLIGPVRISLGNDIRISGKLAILSSSRTDSELRIGNGVFIGGRTRIQVAGRIELGDFVSVGNGTYISDNEGHAHYNPQRPIWEVPPGEGDISEVVIEDNVQISAGCTILKGVRIGARSVIGAHSVVRTNIPPDSIVMGNPARVVKRITAE